MDKPIWEGHQFNGYKEDPKHYNSSEKEKARIINSHSQKSSDYKNRLDEMVSLNSTTGQISYGGHGGPDIKGDNHGMVNDRLGLVVDHLNQVKTNLKKESLWEFAQDAHGWMSRMGQK